MSHVDRALRTCGMHQICEVQHVELEGLDEENMPTAIPSQTRPLHATLHSGVTLASV